MKQYKTILFDVDGTLLDFSAAERLGIVTLLSYVGIEPRMEHLEQYHKLNQSMWKAFEMGEMTREQVLTERFTRFFEGLGYTVDADQMESIYREQLGRSAVLIDGAVNILDYLKGRYGLYVVTNGVSDTQYRRLSNSGLDWYFDKIFVSEDAGSQKPQKEFFEYCFAAIPNLDPDSVLIIGDSLSSDMKGGINAGIDTCWYNPGHAKADPSIPVTYEICSLDEIRKFLP